MVFVVVLCFVVDLLAILADSETLCDDEAADCSLLKRNFRIQNKTYVKKINNCRKVALLGL